MKYFESMVWPEPITGFWTLAFLCSFLCSFHLTWTPARCSCRSWKHILLIQANHQTRSQSASTRESARFVILPWIYEYSYCESWESFLFHSYRLLWMYSHLQGWLIQEFLCSSFCYQCDQNLFVEVIML